MKKLSFNFLLDYNKRLQKGFLVERLQRLSNVQQQYEEHKKQYNNLHEYIMETYLKDCEFNLTVNLFPWNVERNVSHYVLWLKSQNVIDVPNYIKSCFGKKRTVVFMNPENYKSIPTIVHYHVFVEEFVISKF